MVPKDRAQGGESHPGDTPKQLSGRPWALPRAGRASQARARLLAGRAPPPCTVSVLRTGAKAWGWLGGQVGLSEEAARRCHRSWGGTEPRQAVGTHVPRPGKGPGTAGGRMLGAPTLGEPRWPRKGQREGHARGELEPVGGPLGTRGLGVPAAVMGGWGGLKQRCGRSDLRVCVRALCRCASISSCFKADDYSLVWPDHTRFIRPSRSGHWAVSTVSCGEWPRRPRLCPHLRARPSAHPAPTQKQSDAHPSCPEGAAFL